MKIIELIFDLSSGGAERFVVDLSNELSRTEDIVLMTLKNDKVNSQQRRFYFPELSSRVRYVNLGLPDGLGLNAWRTVYKAIKTEGADVLHIHLAPIVNFCIPALFLLRNELTIVQTIHTDFKAGHSGIIYRMLFNTLGRVHKMRWVALSGPNYSDLTSRYPWALSCCIRNGRGPLAASENFEKVAAEVNGYRNSPRTVIFIHVARCIEVKNQMMLVKAFNRFVEGGADAQLLVIGAGFDSVLGEKIIESACPAIHFLGPRNNVADYLLNSDCFCLSSLYEGLPISVLEALMSGTPVLSTPLPGVVDVVKVGFNALISKDFTENSYAEALGNVVERLPVLKANAQAEKDDERYTIKTCAASYVDFFRQDAKILK